MRTNKILSGMFYLLIVITLSGCPDKEDDTNPSQKYDINEIIAAFDASGPWDRDKIIDELKGEWSWELEHCELGENRTRYEDYDIRFDTNGTLEVFENGQLVHTMEWVLGEPVNPDYIVISITPKEDSIPFSYNLGGQVYVADDVLVFSLLPVDGCDSFFKRK